MDFLFDYRTSESPLVELIWHTRSNRAGSFTSVAVAHWEMVVWKHQGETAITMRGPETQASLADCPADSEFLGIQFKLGAFMPHLPTKNRVNSEVHLPEANSKAFWLQGAAWEFPTFENADTFVERLIRYGLLVREPVVEAALNGQPTDLSPRTLQYRFLHATGLTHSTIRQIERARHAMTLLQTGKPILDTVFEAGYFDQPHMTRALKQFTGQTPAQIIRQRETT
jgi:AraC-like DNA-binding protein